MPPHLRLKPSSAYLRDTVGSFSDPLHGHSFFSVNIRLLSTVDRSLLCFRDCLLCHERILAIGKPNHDKTRKKLGPAAFTVSMVSTPGVCQCLSCGKFAHRECVSVSHSHRACRRHTSLMPACSHAPPSTDALLFPAPSSRNRFVEATKAQKKVRSKSVGKGPCFTLATLIEELDSNSVAALGATSAVMAKGEAGTQKKPQLQALSSFAKKLAPVLAAGGVVGVIAMGPAAGVLAGLNMLVTSVGAETVMAGIGLTASAAAAATATHQSNVKATQRREERLRRGEWAMEICWNCKKSFSGAPSDEVCRKDVEFFRRFQLQTPCRSSADDACDDHVAGQETIPDDAEVYWFLFRLFASPSEFLGQMNVQLCAAFRKRFSARHQKRRRRPSFPGNSSLLESDAMRTIAKDTLQDTKMYVAHVLGATLQCFPSLASTSQALSSCTLAIERIIYDDIRDMVFSEFQCTFEDADSSFADNLVEIRRKQQYHSAALLRSQVDKAGKSVVTSVLEEDLQKAEALLVAMMHTISSPLLKLVMLCDAFRNICCFAEKLHQSASNADMLIPILCAFLIECPRVCGPGLNFVSEIAFISFFTNGGGKGVEGYVLTTFQAAIQVIVAVDLPSGHAKELELLIHDDDSEATEEIEDEFFDAVSSTIKS